ncbi:hypothetical protein B5X24_HaOG212290 [Helicoverpa armigera]|uniref:Aminopeptidase P N-terminal domain-containing protein n=1 Tax=Helicoverpa armigera TaxID=29058 RepID=A0A2W1B9K5_HELAM|nr:hypothetical protein B5X24_HaOG212290 [Helicoverpa armigera]
MSVQRLAALRALMASQPQPLAAYIIPTADAHNSEYIAPVDARREWISGFTGSAGTAVVTTSTALVWTDGRYYTQFQREADLVAWTLMKQSQTETPTLEKWLTSNLMEGAVVGVDPHTFTRDEWNPLQTALTKHNMQLIPVSLNLVDEVRRQLGDPPPKRPNNAIIPLPLEYTGKTAGEKIQELREKMAQKKASALVITALDEVAYTLNLRGSDIQYNPVFFSYLIITPTEVKLLTASDLSTAVREHLDREEVQLQRLPISDVEPVLKAMAKKLSEEGTGKHSIWLSSDASEAIHRAAAGVDVLKTPLNLISEISPVALMKLIKNEVELQGFRECHKRDGIAVVRLLKWLHDQIDCDKTVTEIQAADKLLEFRKEESNFMGPSFETIPGAGPNGAIIHYSPSRDGVQKVIEKNDMFLLDSGSQYKDGTTDITRTRHMSRSPTSEQKCAFTRVLKGQIMLGSALFPQGVKTLCRTFRPTFCRKSVKCVLFMSYKTPILSDEGTTDITRTRHMSRSPTSEQKSAFTRVLKGQIMLGSALFPQGVKSPIILSDEGTTDITRTRHMSRSPTSEQKSAFTRVLKGQIMLGSALFPQGVKGNVLDSFARHSLWEVGLDYAHGTGHGVGHFLNVHEGPSGVSWRPYPHDPGLKPAQILSNGQCTTTYCATPRLGFARHSLWEVGLDYAHGTGHGVGHFLNVHEGPSGVSWRPYPHDPGLKPAQILSNEPGYYKVGSFGIRHEDLVETIKVTKDSDHPRANGLQGDYDGRGVLGFHTLTLVPHQRDCIDVNMLTDFELTYLNAYHMRVFDTLGPILKQRGLNEDYKWLQQECDPMTRG